MSESENKSTYISDAAEACARENIFLESLDELTVSDVAPESAKRKKKKRGAAGVLRVMLMIACLTIFCVCIGELADIFIDYYKAGALYDDIANGFNASGNASGDPLLASLLPAMRQSEPMPSYSEQKDSDGDGLSGDVVVTSSIEFQRKLVYLETLRDQNPDIYGYIVIEGTSISYPVVQTTDNEYYLKHGFNGSKLNSGTIFVDFRNSERVEDNRNIVIYGHNMLNGSMFHDVARYDMDFPSKYGARYDGSSYGQGFFDEHHTIQLVTFDGIYTFEIFSFYETDETDKYYMTYFSSDASFMSFCDRVTKKSQYMTEYEMTADDVMLTLSTCVNLTPTGRYACHAKLVKIEK